MRRTLYLIGVMACAAAIVGLGVQALSEPSQRTISFSKTIEARGFTIVLTGLLVVDAANQTVTGNATATVTNSTGDVVATAYGSLSVVANETVNIVINIPVIGVDINIIVDLTSGTVAISTTSAQWRKLRA